MRRIIDYKFDEEGLIYALCDDMTLWVLVFDPHLYWVQINIPEIPQQIDCKELK